MKSYVTFQIRVQKVNNFCFSIYCIPIETTIDDDLACWKDNVIINIFLLSIVSNVTLPLLGVEPPGNFVVLLVVVEGVVLQVHKDVSFKIVLIFD